MTAQHEKDKKLAHMRNSCEQLISSLYSGERVLVMAREIVILALCWWENTWRAGNYPAQGVCRSIRQKPE